MGAKQPAIDREFFEAGSEPEYFVTHTRAEMAGGNNVRIFCYAEKSPAKFYLLYTVVIPSKDLSGMGRRAIMASDMAINLDRWDADTLAN